MENEVIKCNCCPECGCKEYEYKDWLGKGYRVCINCEQEWWTDIKYDSKYCSIELPNAPVSDTTKMIEE